MNIKIQWDAGNSHILLWSKLWAAAGKAKRPAAGLLAIKIEFETIIRREKYAHAVIQILGKEKPTCWFKTHQKLRLASGSHSSVVGLEDTKQVVI